jgi:hypothetical protein
MCLFIGFVRLAYSLMRGELKQKTENSPAVYSVKQTCRKGDTYA